MQELKQKTTTKATETTKDSKVIAICEELQIINNTIISKAKDKSEKDMSIKYEISETPNKININRIKIVSTNYETLKTSVTFYRSFINSKVSEIKQLSKIQFMNIRVFVEDNHLYQAFNLWVLATIQNNKGELLK